mmetsp:Transcript_10017/g.34062  ORF Transcript_10017/g.34062 Transcript_10017/m.34062 type:complete len:485 (-) Transcript_10017:1602-3056(-)
MRRRRRRRRRRRTGTRRRRRRRGRGGKEEEYGAVRTRRLRQEHDVRRGCQARSELPVQLDVVRLHLTPQRVLELERQPCANVAHDVGGAALLALLVVSKVAVVSPRDEEHRATPGVVGHAVVAESSLHDEHAGGRVAPEELVRADIHSVLVRKTRVLEALGVHVDAHVRRGGGVVERHEATRAVHSDADGVDIRELPGHVRRRAEGPQLDRTVPVELQLLLEVLKAHARVGCVLDGDHVRAALAPGQDVAVVLVAAREDHRAPLGGHTGADPADAQNAQELEHGTGASGAREEHHVRVLACVDAGGDDTPCVLAEGRAGAARRRRGGVRVAVQREHVLAHEGLHGVDRAPGRGPVRVHEWLRAERPTHGLELSDDLIAAGLRRGLMHGARCACRHRACERRNAEAPRKGRAPCEAVSFAMQSSLPPRKSARGDPHSPRPLAARGQATSDWVTFGKAGQVQRCLLRRSPLLRIFCRRLTRTPPRR